MVKYLVAEGHSIRLTQKSELQMDCENPSVPRLT